MSLEDRIFKKANPYVPWNLSLSVLMRDHYVQGVDIMAEENKNIQLAILHKYGMNINLPMEVHTLEHRNEFGEVVHCPLFMGYERSDANWLKIKRDFRTWEL